MLNEFGIHLIILPKKQIALNEPQISQITSVVERVIKAMHPHSHAHTCTCEAVHARPDHVHILLRVSGEHAVDAYIPILLSELTEFVRSFGGRYRKFLWQENVHLTILPPWHIPILASFVRDQDNYHESCTLDEEIRDVFMPNARPESELQQNFLN